MEIYFKVGQYILMITLNYRGADLEESRLPELDLQQDNWGIRPFTECKVVSVGN